MNWEKLTAPEFEQGIKTCGGVCLLPCGVIEKHGDHLPLGQDSIFIHKLCSDAAEIEPAMVFPFHFLGRINEARHQPGTIALKFELLLPVLESICDEIGRNGFSKILIVNGHGGNVSLISYFCESLLGKKKNYMVMNFFPWAHKTPETAAALSAKIDGHGGEDETSCMTYYYPELVESNIPAPYGLPLNRLKAYDELGIECAIKWYANYPGHLAADDTASSPEKGQRLVNARIEQLVKIIKFIKHDDTPFKLLKKYQEQVNTPSTKNM